MEHVAHNKNEAREDAVIEALLSPREGSFVDALLMLGDEAARGKGAAMSGFQAALARKMRASIGQDGVTRHVPDNSH